MPDFTLSDEQEMLRDTARALFAKEVPASLVRAAFYDVTDDGPADARRLFDTHLRDWLALGDGPLVDLCLFLEESGTAVAPGPLWVTSSFALPLLRAASAMPDSSERRWCKAGESSRSSRVGRARRSCAACCRAGASSPRPQSTDNRSKVGWMAR